MLADAENWRPLSQRTQPHVDEALFDGVPAHLWGPLSKWVRGYLDKRTHLIDRVTLQLRLDLTQYGRDAPAERLLIAAEAGGFLLDAVDAMIHLDEHLQFQMKVTGPDDTNLLLMESTGFVPAHIWLPVDSPAYQVETLDAILEDGGSAYRVDWKGRQLVRRVEATVDELFEFTLSAAKAASEHLRHAKLAVYGVTPDPAKAFDEIIRAVEAVACPIVLPSNSKATLGQVRRHLQGAPGKWSFSLEREHGSPIEVVTAMIGLLWESQPGRHGGSTSRPPRQDEVETALHLGATLVQWFAVGAIRPANTATQQT
jgi:hypothetical protein